MLRRWFWKAGNLKRDKRILRMWIYAENIIFVNIKQFFFLLDLETHDFIELNWKCPGRKTPQKAEDTPKVETPSKDQWVYFLIYFQVLYNLCGYFQAIII